MKLSDAYVDFIAGWCSGAVAVLACQPVDTVLTRWQAGLVSGRHWALESARTLTSSAGVAALWRGASPMISAIPLQNAMLMGGYGVGQKYAEMYGSNQLNAVFVGGCVGGVLQSFLMSPVELVKVARQCNLKMSLTRNNWTSGLGATLLRDGIPHGAWFLSYQVCKDAIGNDDSVMTPLVSGAAAATIAWGVGYPADLIKTRIQYSGCGGIVDTGRQLIKEANGSVIVGLYRGFGVKLVRAVPASMISFSVYEFVKKQIESF